MMHLQDIHNRWQAFAFHLAISVLVFLALLALIIFVWYPGPFIHMGGWQGIKIVAAVDLVLGPVLTLVVFDKNKKSLKWDLVAIAALQIGCLGYGVWVVDTQRPVTQVLIDKTLYVVTKSDFSDPADLSVIDTFKGPYPKFAILDMPMVHEVIRTTLVSAMFSGTPLHMQTDKYLDARAAEENKIIREKLEWNLEEIEQLSNGGCSGIDIDSAHSTEKVCIDQDGLVSLAK